MTVTSSFPETSPQVALLTPRGRGAVATLRLHGDHTLLDQITPALFRAANQQILAHQPEGQILFGKWGIDHPEDVVVCRLSDQMLEIHCHGGDWAADRILHDCQQRGFEICRWQDLNSFQNNRLATEILEHLSRAITWRTAEYLLSQAEGRLQNAYQGLAILAWNEVERAQARLQIEQLLHWSAFGIHLSAPWRVVLTGPPNVGKSSLINALLGYQRSIVFDQPGTTRDVITAETAFEGWPVQLSDTAGLRETSETLESEGIARARRSLEEADLIVQLIDFTASIIPEIHPRAIVVAHKCDLPGYTDRALPQDVICVSSQTGVGLPELQQIIVQKLIPEVPPVETPIPISARQVELLQTMFDAMLSNQENNYRTACNHLVCSS